MRDYSNVQGSGFHAIVTEEKFYGGKNR